MASVVSPGPPDEETVSLALSVAMRGLVEDLRSPSPIGALLPAVLQEDDFCQRMLGALDEVLAPLFATLDCFDGYLDPAVAPPDFVDWLAGWVGLDIDETWTLERRRRLIQDVVVLYRIRGTAGGLAAYIRLYAGVTPHIEESGGCDWSQTADSPVPGSPRPYLTVRLEVDDPADVRRAVVSRIVDASRPAHVPYQLDLVVAGTTVQGPAEDTGETVADHEAPGAVDLPGSEHIELAPQTPPSPEQLDDPSAMSADTDVTEREAPGAVDPPGSEPVELAPPTPPTPPSPDQLTDQSPDDGDPTS